MERGGRRKKREGRRKKEDVKERSKVGKEGGEKGEERGGILENKIKEGKIRRDRMEGEKKKGVEI